MRREISVSFGLRLVEGADTTDSGTRDNTILGSNTGVDIRRISNDTLIISGADTASGYVMKTYLELEKNDAEINVIYHQ